MAATGGTVRKFRLDPCGGQGVIHFWWEMQDGVVAVCYSNQPAVRRPAAVDRAWLEKALAGGRIEEFA